MTVHEIAVEEHRAMQRPAELAKLFGVLVGRLPAAPRVLEIGSGFGGMLWWYRHALGAELVVSVDIERVHRNADVSFRADSTRPSTVAMVRAFAPYDLVFIDGAGTLEAAEQDWLNYGPLGRVVCFHDIRNPEPETCGLVAQLWRRLRAELGPPSSAATSATGHWLTAF